jgi:hypothetical protein
MGDGQLYDSVLRAGLNDAFSDAASGWHTEDSGEDIPKKPRRSPAVTMSLKGAAPAPKRSWRSSDAATAVGDQALASNWGKQHATLEPLKARTMNLIARPNFAPSRRSLLSAGMTIGTTLALHNAAFAEVTIRRGPMLPIKETDIATNGIHLHVTELGEGPAILFVHGFPDTAYTWRKQMQALAAAGFRAIAPDMRGYGGSSAPADPTLYTPFQTVGDLVGLLDALQVPEAIIVGHDWGANVAWNAAMMRPDRFKAVFCLAVPYSPRGKASVLDAMKAAGRDPC